MTKYAKFISETRIEFPPKNKGYVINYDLNEDLLKADGYKKFIEAEKEIGKSYTITYQETAKQIKEIATEIPQPDPAVIREQEFERDFFNTSLGYIRRSVNMDNGKNKDFLSDLFPTMVVNFTLGATVRVLAYNKPEDFSQEITDWTQYQHWEVLNNQFIQDCSTQLQNDFKPTNENESEDE